MRPMEYFRSVIRELGNVKFPGKEEVKLTTVVIVLILIVMVIFIGLADLVISKLIKTLLGIL